MQTRKSISVKYGLISGIILAVMIIALTPLMKNIDDLEKSGTYGMFGMGIGLSMIFFAIRQVRDKLQNGIISFGEAFKTGLTVAMIGSLFYVVAWMMYFHFVDDSFIEIYSKYQIEQVESGTLKPEEKASQIKDINEMMVNYRKLPVMFAYTLMEIFPFGLMITIICAVLMKRKPA
jgi:hypothetical protein